MKKTVSLLIIGILLIGVNIYAAGDLIVNGQLGVGVTTPTSKFHVEETDAPAYRATATFADLSGAGFTRTSSSFTTTISDVNWNNKKILGFNGGILYTGRATGVDADPDYAEIWGVSSDLVFNSAVAGAHSLTQVVGSKYRLARGSLNNQNITINDYYGIKHTYENSGGTGIISGNNWNGIYLGNPNSSDFHPTNLYGLFIEKQTTGTNNYGVVLDGDGAIGSYGAALVLGASQNAYLYGKSDGVYVYDGTSETKISPHDPETGEWIYYSRNTKTGVVKRVNMEKLVKAVEKLSGETLMVETLIEDK